MEPTIKAEDQIIVNKLYPYIIPVQRGDVIVFKDPGGWLDEAYIEEFKSEQPFWYSLIPGSGDNYLVKRLIGMPGDHVECDGIGPIKINGVEVKEDYLDDMQPSEVEFDVVVPDGYVFVMGDNRSNSADSRFQTNTEGGGFVPISNISGEAFAIMAPLAHLSWIDSDHQVFQNVPSPDQTSAQVSA